MGVRMPGFQLTKFHFHVGFLQAPFILANVSRMFYIDREDNYIGTVQDTSPGGAW